MSTILATRVPILVVEDDLDMQFLIKELLRPDPRLVCVAEVVSTIEAVALTQKMGPILVILDHKLEGEIMGLQGAPMIKSVSPNTRIILFTVLELSDEASKEPAIDLFLSKSKLKELLESAQQVLGLEPVA